MDDKDVIIKRLIDENEYLKGLLKANNILYVGKKYVEDIKLSTNEKLNLYLEYFAFRKSPIRKISFYNDKYYSFIVCNNFYKNNLCNKINNSRYDCLKCLNQEFVSLDEHELIRHLKGDIAYSGYLNLPNDETKILTLFVKDIDYKYIATAFKKVAYSYGIEVTLVKGLEENEIYIYIFFEIAVKLNIARQIGQFLLDEMFNKSNIKLNLSLYNSLIPNSDYESNNIGSIVPFPLSMMMNKNGETLMLDENFLPYKNQFSYLKTVQKVNISKINYIISKLNEVNNSASKGLFKNFCLNENDFPKTMTIYIKNMIEVPIDGLSGRAINFLKRLGSVINSKYYENQRRRLSVYNEPKYIILYEDNNPLYLKLPIGTLDSLKTTFNKAKVNFEVKNLREEGDKINVTFKGILKPEQELAFGEIINFDNGTINAPTGFGKTVLAIYLISYFKVNTLILVNKQTLLNQWLEKLEETI